MPSVAAPTTRQAELDAFLCKVERRALRHAELAGLDRDAALALLQQAMQGFVRAARGQPPADWPLLFWRQLDKALLTAQRRRSFLGRWFGWLGLGDEESSGPDTLAGDHAPRRQATPLSDREAAAALEFALRSLPLRQREAFLLRVWEGLDVSQAAAAMGLSEGSVKTHLFRALQALRARLESNL